MRSPTPSADICATALRAFRCADDAIPVSFYRFKDTGGSRDTHETDTRTSQTNLKTNPTHRLTRQTTPEPRYCRSYWVFEHYCTQRAEICVHSLLLLINTTRALAHTLRTPSTGYAAAAVQHNAHTLRTPKAKHRRHYHYGRRCGRHSPC